VTTVKKVLDIKWVFLLAVPIAVLFFMVFVALTSDYLLPGFDPFQHQVLNGAYRNELSEEEAKAVTQLLSQGVIVSPQDLLSSIVGFYTFISQMLLGIMAILGVVAFMSIKLISEEKLEIHADKTIRRQFLSREFNDDIQARIDGLAKPVLTDIQESFSRLSSKDLDFENLATDIEKLNDMSGEVGNLKTWVETISVRISELDGKEDNGSSEIDPSQRS